MDVKSHLKKYKQSYICGAIGVAGITCLIMKGNRFGYCPVQSGPLAELPCAARRTSSVSSFTNISGTVIANNTGPVIFGGYSRKLVQNSYTGEIFDSVSKAADSAGVGVSKMSKHLNGHKDHVNGTLYRIIGIGTGN